MEGNKLINQVKPLPPDALITHTNPDGLGFETTQDLDDLVEAIGQPRAVEAVKFGTGIAQEGYNIYAMGPSGLGKRSLVEEHFKQRAANEPVPPDWVYVYNFEQNHHPKAISLPPGKGTELKQDMERFTEELRTTLTSAFESDEYRARRQAIEQEVQEQQEKDLEQLQKRSQEQGFALVRTPAGLIFAPMREGDALSPEEFQNLPEEERKRLEIGARITAGGPAKDPPDRAALPARDPRAAE